MSRKKDIRQRRSPLKLQVERLETKRLMSVGNRKPQLDHPTVALHQPLESLLASRTDADSFAWALAHRPKLAADLGLGALSKALTQHAGYAERYGWGASLVHELTTHPRYAAAHHLAAMTAPTAPSPIVTTTSQAGGFVRAPLKPNPPAPPTPVPPNPPVSVQDPQTVAVGGALDVTLPSLGLAATGLTYTITPQPLPANMNFNRVTGELIFAPAPGQEGTFSFSVAVSNGTSSGTVVLPITVTDPAVASTEVSGQVVDENGSPLAGMPVTIDGSSTVTDQAGDFTLTGITANPGPLAVGGPVASTQGRLALTAPVAQLLGHDLYTNTNNVVNSPLILPRIDWSSPSSFNGTNATQPLNISNPATPDFNIQLPANPVGAASVSGALSLAELPAALSAEHMPQGLSGQMLLYRISGASLSQPVMLTIPNTGNYKPGSVLNLYLMNMQTGGHDLVGQMTVSADGRTMTSTGTVQLGASNQGGSVEPASAVIPLTDPTTMNCIIVGPAPPSATQMSMCDGCQQTVDSTAPPGNSSPVGSFPSLKTQTAMASDAGLVTGEYFLDHQLVSYQSQGEDLGIDLQYSSAQADPEPVVQYEFTTPAEGDSSSITSINAQVSLAGVIQGPATTYNTPGGLTDGETYNIPLEVNASSLATGVYTYTMTVTENFGSGSSETSVTTTEQGYVNVVNESSDPLGAGWSVGGLQHLAQVSPGGPVLITEGQQGTERFDSVYSSGQSYVQDLALVTHNLSSSDYEIARNNGSGAFSIGDITSNGGLDGLAVGDFNGNGLPDLATVVTSSSSGRNMTILLNNGSGGFTPGYSFVFPSTDMPRAVAVGNFTGHSNGVLDVAVLLSPLRSNQNYSVAIFTGSGNGSFSGPVYSTAGNGVSAGQYPDSMIAASLTGTSASDLIFATDDGKVDIMEPTSGGSMSAATTLALPSGHEAVGVTSAEVNGEIDLIVDAANTNVSDGGGPFASLDFFTNNGSGAFTFTSTYQTIGHPDYGPAGMAVTGLVAGDFQGAANGLEVAVPIEGDAAIIPEFLDVVPISTSGVWGSGVTYPLGNQANPGSAYGGNIVAADLNGSGKPSIALTDGNGNIWVFLADPDSGQFLPAEQYSDEGAGTEIAVAPFTKNPAVPAFRGPTSDPSTLVHNGNGTWTRTYPDGTVIQFNSAGQETSEADRNGNTFTYAYVTSGPATGALSTITDPVGLITTLSYNPSSGDLTTVKDPASRVTTFVVDSHDNLTQITDPDGASTQYGYSTPANHEATSETDPNNNTATAHYNSFGQLTGETLFDGSSSTSISSAQSRGLLAPGGSGSLPTTYQATVTDPDLRTTTLTFNWMSHPTGETDPNGGSTAITYNQQGFPLTETDALGRVTTYTYDSVGDVLSITEPYVAPPGGASGGVAIETISYNDPYGVPTSITDFNGNTTTFTLDSHGNVLQETQPGSVVQSWTYNSAGQPLTYTDANGKTATYTYNGLGRLTTITEPQTGSPTVQYHYDSAGDLTSVTDEVGDTTTYTYDLMGRLLTEQNPVQAAAGKETVYTYDKDGNLLTSTDANGHTTSYSYNARDELANVSDPLNDVTTYGYDASGNVTTVTNPLNKTTSFTYTVDNLVATVTDPLGKITSYTYDLDEEETAVTDANGNTTQFGYDALGRMETETLPLSTGSGGSGGGGSLATYTYGYDLDGNLLTVTDPLNHTTSYTYNALDEETSSTNPDGDTTRYTYDGDGNVLTVSDGLGHTTSYSYDSMDRLLTETQPSGGGTTSYAYDAAGDLMSVTDPDSNRTTYTYNAAHELATETSPTGGVTTYTYDLVGNLTQVVDPDGHTIQYTYDGDNRETLETWVNPSGGSALNLITYTYNADSELTAVSDNNSSYQYTYNADGEETSQGDVGSPHLPTVTLTYSYDPNGNRTSMTDSLGGVVSYTYDSRNVLVNETLSGTGISAEAVGFAYDNAENMTGEKRYSNLAETTLVAATTYTYDAANQMTGITDKNSSGTTLVSYAYTYDAASRVSQEVRTWSSGSSTDTLTYGYTNNNQLTSVSHTNSSFANESFTYDANGNQTGTGYTTTTGNEQTASPGYTYTYDADGNMLTSTQTSTGNKWTYTYDFRNRMTGAVEKTSGGTVLAQATYTYDALDNRIGMNENGTQTWTLFDGSSPIIDFNSSGSLTMRYLNGPAGDIVDAVLARQTSGGTVSWYLPDRLGTIRDLISNSGSVIDHVDYSAFGTVLGESSPSNGDRMIGFSGLERDTVTGLNLAVHRVENPGTGRWTSKDPLGFAAGDANLYRYVENVPSYATDPSGLYGDIVVKPPIPNPQKTIVLVGPPHLNDNGADRDRRQRWGKVDFCARGGIPNNQYIQFNGLNDLKNKVNKYKGKNMDVIIWVHGGPGIILVGEDPKGKTPVSLNQNYQPFADILKSLNPAQVTFWGCSVMGEIGKPPVGNPFLKQLQTDLGNPPLTGPVGPIEHSPQGFSQPPGGKPVAVPR